MNTKALCGKVIDAQTEKGIENVSVTDGKNVVKTDVNGYFSLDGWDRGKFISVTQASGYECESFYQKIEKNKKEYIFVFKKSKIEKGSSHSFIQVSDTEIGPNANLSWIEETKNVIKQSNPAFLIHTGDICYKYGLTNHIKYMNAETMNCPTYYVIGNHDYVEGAYGEELYESIYGPTWYSFEVGNVHYAVTAIHYGDEKSGYEPTDCWRWLENDLNNTEPDMKVIIFNHTKSPTQDYVLPLKFDKLDLKKYNLTAWIFGHYHYNYISKKYGVINISTARPDCGGIDSSPAGIREITVTDTIKTKMHYKDMGKSTEPKGAIWSTSLLGNVLFCDTLFENGYLYTATSCDENPCDCGVYCINADTGEIKWFFKTVNSIKNNILLYKENVIAMDVQGRVYCINKKNGKLVWKQKVGVGRALGTSSAITANDETLFAGCSCEVTALDIDTGNVKWSNNLEKGENSPAEFVCSGKKLLVSSHWGSLDCLDSSTGRELWANSDKDLRFRSSTPVFINDRMILVADSKAIMVVDSENGMIESKKVFEDIDFSSSAKPLINGDIAYIATVNRGVVAYSLAKREILAEFIPQKSILFTAPYSGENSRTVESTPVIDGDTLYFGANDGYVYAVDLTKNKVKNKYNVGSAVLNKAAVYKNRVFAGGFKGFLACFKK